jgi:hypothetical protein
MRVPFTIHWPDTLPGTRSTAGQPDHSILGSHELPLVLGQSGPPHPRYGAYSLILELRDAIPHLQPPLATAEFTTLRLRLIKIAACVTETASRVRLAFAVACPEAALFTGLARSLQPAGP